MIEKRPFGSTNDNLSLLGFGGILVTQATTEEAAERVATAFDAGINYFDVAPSYGNAEEMLGPALQPYRDRVFLACKTMKRDRKGAEDEMANSLRLLHTDRFDLYQMHALSKMEELDMAFAPGGAMETLVAARDAGKVRYLGFSAHSAEVAIEALRRFPFDSVLFPINFVTWNVAGFGPQVVDKAREIGAARLALKAMARGPIPDGTSRPWAKCWYAPLDDPDEATLALRWTLSQDITAAIPPGEWPLFEIALRAAQSFTPLSDDERTQVEASARGEAPLFRLATVAG